MEKSPPGIIDYLMLVTLSAIFGAAFMLITIAIETVPTMTVVAARLLLSAVIFLLVAKIVGQRLFVFSDYGMGVWGAIIASGLFGNALPFFLITWGQEKVDAGLAAILITLMPLVTIVLAHFFSEDERIGWAKVIGLICGLFGVIFLFGFDKLLSLGDEALRQYAILGAAVCYAINVIIMKKLTKLPRYSTIAAVLCVSFIMVFPFAIFVDRFWTIMPSARSVVAVVMLGLISSGFGSLLRFAIVARQGAAFISQINYLIPLMAVFWGWLFLSQVPEIEAYIALGFILAGIAIVRFGEQNKHKRAANTAANISPMNDRKL